MIRTLAEQARLAAKTLATVESSEKAKALQQMADALIAHSEKIKSENARDMEAGRANHMSEALLDRLLLTDARIQGMAIGLRELADAEDPIGQIGDMWRTKHGLQIGKMSVPLGVIAMIYEARPNVTADAAGLCLKSGNAVVLRGSGSAIHSNQAIVAVMREALAGTAVPQNAIQLVEDTRHESVYELLKLNGLIDLAIPRGGAGLIRSVVENASIPVIETGTGNCHLYVDQAADLDQAKNILMNGKLQRPGVCNALESLLVHQSVAGDFLPEAVRALQAEGVEVRGCETTRALCAGCQVATEEDYATEYNDLIIAVKVVASMDEAVAHIDRFGSGHSEVIVSEHYSRTKRFLETVDAACVYANASSRFSDGSEFGFGAEIGISTQKMHARGPMGLKALTSYKYIVLGEGQIRA